MSDPTDARASIPASQAPPPSPAQQVRRLLRQAETATLTTALARDGRDSPGWGWPYPSLVLATVDHAGCPLLLLSDLADHSANLAADGRAGFLVRAGAGQADPLAGARAAVLGRIAPSDDPLLKQRVLRRHPGAAVYADFADFRLYRLAVERAHLVAGFGRIHWLTAAELLFDTAACVPLAAAEAEIVAHMNADHADALAVMAAQFLALPEADAESDDAGEGAQAGAGWTMTGVDPEGCDLRRGGRLARLDFAKPVHDAESCRVELVRLTRQARRRAQSAVSPP